MTIAWKRFLTAYCSLLLTALGMAQAPAKKMHKLYPQTLRAGLEVLPKQFKIAQSQFVIVGNVDAQFPHASYSDRAMMRESAMFTYSLGPAGVIYVNEQSAFFRAAEEADRRFGRGSPFKYAIAALIAHEICHLRKAPVEPTSDTADTCYSTELSVFLSFVQRGYLQNAAAWAEMHSAALKAAIAEEQVSTVSH